ncbi:hypothetical protein G6F68_019996 [Rhizopus microsporus]|nr:hypothetical protein G6F68_019996 [Rhizopus microsporus]
MPQPWQPPPKRSSTTPSAETSCTATLPPCEASCGLISFSTTQCTRSTSEAASPGASPLMRGALMVSCWAPAVPATMSISAPSSQPTLLAST